MSSIEINDLTKKLNGNIILNKLNLKIEEKSFFTILGKSGCGKTTLLKAIAGIYDIDKGNININGENILRIPMEKRNIPFVFQDHLLFPHMNVFDNIAFGLKIRNTPKKDVKLKVEKIIDLLKLNNLENNYPKQLSGGQKQRVSIGRALVMEPKILLMDEPFSSLDINLREYMRNLIKDIHKMFGLTIIFVTHDKEEALCVSDKIALMDEGKILQVGTPYEIYEEPASIEVAKFFGNCNLIEGKIENEYFSNSIWNIKLKTKKSNRNICTLCTKAEDIGIHLNNQSNITIYKKTYIGDKFIYTLKNKNEEINVSCDKNINLNINDKVGIEILGKADYSIF